MLSVSSGQLEAWIAAFAFPLARILGVIAAAPLFNSRGVPTRIRLALGLAVALAVVPALPPMPRVPLSSWLALTVLAQEAFIGIAMGFVLRLVFVAVDAAGELIGLQMGLSFATFFDPEAGGQTIVLAEFLGLLTSLIFLGINGHLLLLEVAAHSFEWLPVATPISARGWHFVAYYGITVFSAGFLLALPLIAALLITNIAMGVLTRAAPQLNLFAVGFPITMTAGFLTLILALSAFGPVVQRLFEGGFEAIDLLLRALAG
ncbi:MAG: flagellar biosynthetic protein FliR [Rhodocyclaceae bacterium]|jgi:flagellar biosynthetic protein FliR|nr:flagellar biosynthetic protein FliR [Rhodocyclaceae bacterium]